jgi:tRNA (adenine37-N6)-methyltransferase
MHCFARDAMAAGDNWQSLGILRTPWPEKFGVPRQAGLTRAACRLVFDPAIVDVEMLRGLEAFSHLWILFVFHRLPATSRSTVRPPRLGGNARVGVFATRSGFRPNRIGCSAVRLVGIEGLSLALEGGDFVDGTPVVDIKPYLPWSDAIPDARADWSAEPPARFSVRFDAAAERQLAVHARAIELQSLIIETLSLDPRPSYLEDSPDRRYGVRILDVDVRFTRDAEAFVVQEIVSAAGFRDDR